MKTKHSILALLFAGLLAIPFAIAVGEPENVTGLNANAISENAIGLSWNSVRDANGGLVNHYRIYYGTTSIQTTGKGEYDHEADTPNNNTAYVVANLQPGTTYYFSATAMDSNGVESDAYSIEANTTTLGETSGADVEEAVDTASPSVLRVTAPYKTTVIVEFSEPIILPAQAPQSVFTINEQLVTSNVLEVKSAQADNDNQKVILETAPQNANTSYIVTAGVAVTDVSLNPIISGNTDSGLFTGSSADAPQEIAQNGTTEEPLTELPEVLPPTPEPLNCGNDETCFYDNLKICTPSTIVQVKDQTQTKRQVTGTDNNNCVLKYEVAGILDLNNPKTLECRLPIATLQERINKLKEPQNKLFTDEKEIQELCIGSYLNEFVQSMFAAAPELDTTPPENVTSLVLSFREQMEKFIIMLRWVASLNSAGDLVDQILYMSMDRGSTYGAGASLGPIKTNHEIPDLEGGKEYTFKLTTKDAAGNESTGVVKSIRLPQTGAAAGFLVISSLLLARRLLKRKQV